MTVIGFLACKMLQDEMIYLILNDPEIKEITVIENGEHDDFIQKLDDAGIPYSLKPTIHSVPNLSDRTEPDKTDVSLVVWILELTFHYFPNILKEEVYSDLTILAEKAEGTYLLYGLCGNALTHVETDFKDTYPVVILRDPDGEIADDCIGAAIGGRRQYFDLLKSFCGVGTLIFTPMYEATIDEFFNYSRNNRGLTEKQIIKTNKFMFESSNYKRIARLDTGLYYTKDTDEMLERFADTYDLEIFDLKGGHQELFVDCYQKLKELIADSKIK